MCYMLFLNVIHISFFYYSILIQTCITFGGVSLAREKGLSKQVQDILDLKLKIGSSKHADKKLGVSYGHIYSWGTYRTYLKHGCYFVKWCKENYKCKTLSDCRPYVDEYLKMRIDNKISPYTQKLDAAAIAKIYSCKTTDFINTETRHRKDISRSRGNKVRDKHFSEENNKLLIDFCKATGLRRSELRSLTKEQLRFDEQTNSYYLVVKGKGGRVRNSLILTSSAVELVKNSKDKVFDKIPNGADIHSYRAFYCTAIYNKFKRDLSTLKKSDIYYCRGDLKGIGYDKNAMLIASNALGHNRISVIAGHYIRSE